MHASAAGKFAGTRLVPIGVELAAAAFSAPGIIRRRRVDGFAVRRLHD